MRAPRSLEKGDAIGRWETFRIRQYDPICQHWLILHKVDNNDQMRCGPHSFRVLGRITRPVRPDAVRPPQLWGLMPYTLTIPTRRGAAPTAMGVRSLSVFWVHLYHFLACIMMSACCRVK